MTHFHNRSTEKGLTTARADKLKTHAEANEQETIVESHHLELQMLLGLPPISCVFPLQTHCIHTQILYFPCGFVGTYHKFIICRDELCRYESKGKSNISFFFLYHSSMILTREMKGAIVISLPAAEVSRASQSFNHKTLWFNTNMVF